MGGRERTQKFETVCEIWIILSVCCLELFEACFPRRLITRYQLLIALPERAGSPGWEPGTTKDTYRVDARTSSHREMYRSYKIHLAYIDAARNLQQIYRRISLIEGHRSSWFRESQRCGKYITTVRVSINPNKSRRSDRL